MVHRALSIPFKQLYQGLQEAVAAKLVNKQTSSEGLEIFSYSDECVYEKVWNDFTRIARGLIIDPVRELLVALPFEKFFNYHEFPSQLPEPSMAFETFEKIDGSLIIVFHYNGKWQCATRGSFQSDQAKWATEWLYDKMDLSKLNTEVTYLAEAVYPANRIVINYNHAGLYLLAAFNRMNGKELSYNYLSKLRETRGWLIAKRVKYPSLEALLEQAQVLPGSEEGWVLRYENGYRVKIKGDEYTRIHRLISRLTPLSLWESMFMKDPLNELKKELPEEYWEDFDSIRWILQDELIEIIQQVKLLHEVTKENTDKELGLMLPSIAKHLRGLIFPYRKNQTCFTEGRARQMLFRLIRPTGNYLEGYRPSSSVNRIQKEAA